MSLTFMLVVGAAVLVVVSLLIAVAFRVVVPTNMVHIVQNRSDTKSYGTGQDTGRNVYYQWPSWVPWFGVTVIALPISNFDLSLRDYEAYDKDRVPFMVDVTAFFRIQDTRVAAGRVVNVGELSDQLLQIVQGAVRKVLASDTIDSIMLERAQFGEQFTAEVQDQLKEWGVVSVKSMELMDIRDTGGSKVIHNIQAKKTSHIEMESRREVAENKRAAETAEIEAQQSVDVRQQEALLAVGQRTAEKEKGIGIANEIAKQEIQTQAAITKEKEMAVVRVAEVKKAEITKEQQVVTATQDKETTVIRAEGDLAAKKKEAEGVKAMGEAAAAAEQAMQMAPVQAQIALAKEIGTNEGYMQYLMTVESIKGYIVVGGAQAEALKEADVKVISNAGSPVDGVRSVMDLFSSKGGTALGAAVEAFAQTPMGAAMINRVTVPPKTDGVDEASSTK